MYSTLGRNKCIHNCSWTCEGKTPLGGSKSRGQNNIKSELKEQSVKIFYNGGILWARC
jgi:hypothetical protein